MIDREAFLSSVELSVFGDDLSTPQADGLRGLLDIWEGNSSTNLDQLAYALAVATRDTAGAMQPVSSEPGDMGVYGVTGKTYQARGFIAGASGLALYSRLSNICGRDLVSNPEALLEPVVAGYALFTGLERGVYTGVPLEVFINDTSTDFDRAWEAVYASEPAHPLANLAGLYRAALGAE